MPGRVCLERGSNSTEACLNFVLWEAFCFVVIAAKASHARIGKSNNNIGDNGAAGLVDGLKTNSTLQGLYLVSSVGVCVMFRGEQVVGLIRLACWPVLGWKYLRRRRCTNHCRGAKSQPQSASAVSCKSLCFCDNTSPKWNISFSHAITAARQQHRKSWCLEAWTVAAIRA